ncbi:MAG: bifunctional 3,4-dihydroxy-2-butanone-4-phosphate synthase/GTP cyclohydrolase II, partial [Promethearchaeota archaeon]
KPDERDYGIAANILNSLEIKSIRLLTNNPDKILQLQDVGVRIVERVPLIVEPTQHSEAYLRTKHEKAGHLLGKLSDLRDVDNIVSKSRKHDKED